MKFEPFSIKAAGMILLLRSMVDEGFAGINHEVELEGVYICIYIYMLAPPKNLCF